MSTRKAFVDGSDISSAIFDLSSTSNALAAAGTDQAGATALGTNTYQRVATVGASSGVRLPAAVAGTRIVVFNAQGTNALNVYPSSGQAINSLSANVAFSVAVNRGAEFVCCVDGTWNVVYGA